MSTINMEQQEQEVDLADLIDADRRHAMRMAMEALERTPIGESVRFERVQEIQRVPVEYLEHLGEVGKEKELPCDPFTATEPYPVNAEDFED